MCIQIYKLTENSIFNDVKFLNLDSTYFMKNLEAGVENMSHIFCVTIFNSSNYILSDKSAHISFEIFKDTKLEKV